MKRPELRAWREPALLFALGLATVAAGPAMGLATGQVWLGLVPVALVGLFAGVLEARHVARTGRHRWIGAWGWAALGIVVLATGTLIKEMIFGPWGPDSGMAAGIVVGFLLVVLPAFALFVHVAAWIAGRFVRSLRPPTV